MITKVELYKDGKKMIYHQTTNGQKAWVHEPGAPCEVCDVR